MDRLEKQLALLIELDKLKSVLRRTRVKSAEGRLENSGEHSWHVALMAVLMEEHRKCTSRYLSSDENAIDT